jgi:hypothetical protein
MLQRRQERRAADGTVRQSALTRRGKMLGGTRHVARGAAGTILATPTLRGHGIDMA